MRRQKQRDREAQRQLEGRSDAVPDVRHQVVPSEQAPERHGVVAFLSSSVRSGPWSVARFNRAAAVLGSVEIDLRAAQIPQECEIEVMCAFGSVEITVPPGVRVTHEEAAFAASFEVQGGEGERDERTYPSSAPHVHVRASVYFGSVEIRVRRADDYSDDD